MEPIEVKLKITGPMGTAQPFLQGGSWRLTIPKEAVKRYKLEEKYKRSEYGKEVPTFVFLDTSKGMFILPLSELISQSSIENALTKFVDTSSITEDDLKILIERLSEQNIETQP